MNAQAKIDTLTKESKLLTELIQKYPDLREYKGRWRTYYCSKLVNNRAVEYHTKHSCGCCDDAVLYAMPYEKNRDVYVYSDPPEIYIGERAYYMTHWEKLDDGWENSLRSHNVNEIIIDKIRERFKDNKYNE